MEEGVCICGDGGSAFRGREFASGGRGFCISGEVRRVCIQSAFQKTPPPTGPRKADGTHPTGMLSCLKKSFGLW